MSSRPLDYSNTKPQRECNLSVGTSILHALLPASKMDEKLNCTARFETEGKELVIEKIETKHPSFDDFFVEKAKLYIYPTSTLPANDEKAPIYRRVDIWLATNENKLFAALKKLTNAVVEIKPLPFGDVVFMLDGTTRLDFVIERKAAEDFVSSKLDGRLEMQTDVMLRNINQSSMIFHCIEGELFETRPRKNFNHKAILGSLIYPMLRHNISVSMVDSVEGTAAFIKNVHDLLIHAPPGKFDEKQTPDTKALNSTVKKKDISEDNQVFAQLANIREVGPVSAAAIVKKYVSFCNIFQAYIKRGANALADTPTDSGKVGERVSKRIFDLYRPDQLVETTRKMIKRAKIVDDDAE